MTRLNDVIFLTTIENGTILPEAKVITTNYIWDKDASCSIIPRVGDKVIIGDYNGIVKNIVFDYNKSIISIFGEFDKK